MPTNYRVKLNQIPDTINKQVIYGYIEMESGEYYDKRRRGSHNMKMKYHFRSQFRNLDYLELK